MTCNSVVLETTVLVNCANSDGLPPEGTVQCAVNNNPPFNCEILNLQVGCLNKTTMKIPNPHTT